MKKNRTITIAYRASYSINVIRLIPDGQLSCCWVWGKGRGWVVKKVVVWLVTGAVYLKEFRNFRVFLYHKDFSIFLCGNFILFGKRIRKKNIPQKFIGFALS